MGKKLPYTPKSKIEGILRRYIWLRSRERIQALQRDKYTCQDCNRKKSIAKGKEFKVEVHHLDGSIPWDTIVKCLRKYLLVDPNKMVTLCPECHDRRHKELNE